MKSGKAHEFIDHATYEEVARDVSRSEIIFLRFNT